MENNANDLVEQLVEKLKNSVVTFTYQKVNGEFRDATGTLNMDEIPEDMHPKNTDNTSNTSNDNILKYFDVYKQSWRSFRKDNLIKIY